MKRLITLVLQGRYDTQIHSESAAQVMEGLPNGTFVEFSSAGHAVIVFSQCAKDIGDRCPDQPRSHPRYTLYG